MRVFLSYASEDRNQAEAIYLSLRGQGHTVFFDRTDLPPGEEYDARIRRGIERSQLLVFLVSPYSLDAGSYTLTELDIAQKTWEHPTGKVLPVVVRPTPLDRIPPYLKSVTLLETEGNVVATVADSVHRLALERRRAILKTVAKGLAIAGIVCAGAYFYWAHRQPSRETTGKDGAPAVFVPAGNFTMGDDEESPLREIYLDVFYVDKYEVTVSRYAKFLQTTGGVRPPDLWEEASLDGANEMPGSGWIGTTPMRTASGRASDCLRRRNGKRQRAGRIAAGTRGAMTNRPHCARTSASRRRVLTREDSRRWVVAKRVAVRTARRILPAMLRSG